MQKLDERQLCTSTGTVDVAQGPDTFCRGRKYLPPQRGGAAVPLCCGIPMGFASTYVLCGGTKQRNVRMCGNAVTPPTSRDLVGVGVQSLLS